MNTVLLDRLRSWGALQVIYVKLERIFLQSDYMSGLVYVEKFKCDFFFKNSISNWHVLAWCNKCVQSLAVDIYSAVVFVCMWERYRWKEKDKGWRKQARQVSAGCIFSILLATLIWVLTKPTGFGFSLSSWNSMKRNKRPGALSFSQTIST